MTEEKSRVIHDFLYKHENKAFFLVEIIEALEKKGVTLKNLMEFINKLKGEKSIYIESAEPFGEGVLLTAISQEKPSDEALEEARLRVKERKEELEAKALETAYKIMSFVGRGSFILDVGCGSGRVSIPLAEAGNTVVGVDLSKHQILQAKKWAKERNVNLDLVVGIMENLPFKTYFKSLICFFSLEFAPDPFKALREFHRVLEEKGFLIVSLLPALDEHVRGRDFRRFMGNQILTNTIQPWEVVSLLEETGFIVTRQEPVQFLVHIPNEEIKQWVLRNPRVAMCAWHYGAFTVKSCKVCEWMVLFASNVILLSLSPITLFVRILNMGEFKLSI